jgi:hypothetical protein
MKSRITIEVDFNHNNLPVIQVLQESSPDVRDNLVQAFLQSLQHTSRWATITYDGEGSIDGSVKRWKITPITPSKLEDEIKLMQATLNQMQEPVPVPKNIPGLH